METFKIVLVVGLFAGLVAVGLSFAVALLRGTTVTGDEIAKNILLGFVVSAIAVTVVRTRVKP